MFNTLIQSFLLAFQSFQSPIQACQALINPFYFYAKLGSQRIKPGVNGLLYMAESFIEPLLHLAESDLQSFQQLLVVEFEALQQLLVSARYRILVEPSSTDDR